MSKFSVDVINPIGQAGPSAEPSHAHDVDPAENGPAHEAAAAPARSDAGVTVAEATGAAVTVGVVVIGAAVLEAALIPGILVGAAAALAPKYLPKMGDRLQPLFNSTVRGIYKLGRRARTAVGEVQESIHDIAAEVQAEETAVATTPPVVS